MAQYDSAAAVSGNHSPLLPNKPLSQAAAGIPWGAVPSLFPRCAGNGHTMAAQGCAQGWQLGQQKDFWGHKSDTWAQELCKWEVSERQAFIIRKGSWLLAGVPAAGEDSAHFTALTAWRSVCILVLNGTKFEVGCHPERCVWDSSPLPKTLHLQQGKF